MGKMKMKVERYGDTKKEEADETGRKKVKIKGTCFIIPSCPHCSEKSLHKNQPLAHYLGLKGLHDFENEFTPTFRRSVTVTFTVY
jgi:hypothetical protein